MISPKWPPKGGAAGGGATGEGDQEQNRESEVTSVIERHPSTVKVPDGSLPDAGVEALIVTAPAKSGFVEQETRTPALVENVAENESRAGGDRRNVKRMRKLEQQISNNFKKMKKVARRQAFHLLRAGVRRPQLISHL
ncbi:unnamed protein product [Orchesella dallaii]|uniref:Uncharacterized protein n=1 Tax=Orchesella dallaii TaxID=48710 RepID=A0ABP1RH35_9HEXA